MSSAGSQQTKPTRVLACALCKQRRVKCSRSFPCTNCVRAGVPCLQSEVKQRRRRFAERELLDRIHHYEDLLRQNNVSFEPLHSTGSTSATPGDGEHSTSRGNKDHRTNQPTRRGVRHTIKRVREDDEDDESDGTSSSYDNVDQHVKGAALANDHLLFGAPNPDVHLAASHPEQVQIFKLWQIYLDNVNPLLKVTHTPTLQPRIIDAASDIENISPSLDALMFSIYCAAVLSLTDDECRVSFRLSRDYLLSLYQVACKQALLKCAPWRSNDRDCLTALYLYLESVGQQVDPRSLACMAAVAIRIAQRMGIHCESSYNTPGCTALEAEMRRRLWWSLVLFDHRICEIVGQERSTTLSPTWDCRVPLNVNDFEMQAGMRNAPAEHRASATEALFAVVRSEQADFVRHSASHLTTIGGSQIAGSGHEGRELKVLETTIQDEHLAHCNEEVPLHYMTVWATRSFLARSRLMKHYLTRVTSTSDRPTDAQRSSAYDCAIRMVECDTQLRTSPLTKGYLWLVESWYSPVFAYRHMLNELAKRPDDENANKAWIAMRDNYEALAGGPKHHRTRLMFALKFSRITLQAWDARETLLRQEKSPAELPPRLVLDARMNVMQTSSSDPPGLRSGPEKQSMDIPPKLSPSRNSGTDMPLVFPTSLDLYSHQDFGGGHDFADSTAGFYPDTSDQIASNDGELFNSPHTTRNFLPVLGDGDLWVCDEDCR